MISLSTKLSQHITEVKDFPKPGISYKDITPVLQNSELCGEILDALVLNAQSLKPSLIVGLESRGFMFGFALSQRLGIGFVPIRKPGKLPREVHSESYELEYGSAILELHREDIKAGSRVIIHDDLLATGGTAAAAAKLVQKVGAQVVGLDFLIELGYLEGRKLLPSSIPVHSVLQYH